MGFFEVIVNNFHIGFRAAGEIGDEIRHQELLFACLAVHALKYPAECLELPCFTLSHQSQDGRVEMFRSNAELAGNIFGYYFLG